MPLRETGTARTLLCIVLRPEAIQIAFVGANHQPAGGDGRRSEDRAAGLELPAGLACGKVQGVQQPLASADEHPIAVTLLEYRTLAKLKGTYVDALPRLVDPASGRVHTSFHPTGAATGRLSSSDPNLQNIPARTEAGRRIREAFVPEEGFVFLASDYSQVELRVLAHLTGAPELIAAFRAGEDIHRHTAARVFDVLPDLVTDDMRRRAKAVNFGVLYGMSETRLARTCASAPSPIHTAHVAPLMALPVTSASVPALVMAMPVFSGPTMMLISINWIKRCTSTPFRLVRFSVIYEVLSICNKINCAVYCCCYC